MYRMPREHWDHIYSNKKLTEVSWYQPKPKTSLDLILDTGVSKNAKIIDVGGGDSFLVDHLLELGFTNLTVLDISKVAIERAKARLGEKSNKVNWIVSNVIQFKPKEEYDLWHDRATFHFLTDAKDVNFYMKSLFKALKPNASCIIGTFSENGPEKCCQLPIEKYSTQQLSNLFAGDFETIKTKTAIHLTPFDSEQEFNFIQLKKI